LSPDGNTQALIGWRKRFICSRISGIEKDSPRPGRKKKIDANKVRLPVRFAGMKHPDAMY